MNTEVIAIEDPLQLATGHEDFYAAWEAEQIYVWWPKEQERLQREAFEREMQVYFEQQELLEMDW